MKSLASKNAICYVGFGDLYLAQALLSIKSIRKLDKDIKILIITNIEFDYKKIEFWNNKTEVKFVKESMTKNRNYKTNINKYINADKVAYIDSDTIVLSKLDLAWGFLDYFDVCFKFNPFRQKKPGKGNVYILDKKYRVDQLPHFNGGVFFFRKSKRSNDFFEMWNDGFKNHNSQYDQISLNEALFRSNVRILPLTSEWNFFPDLNYYKGGKRNPIIFHYTNRISYVLENELLSIAKLIEINTLSIKEKISKRRKERRLKIGRLEWLKLCILWVINYKYEKRKLNLDN